MSKTEKKELSTFKLSAAIAVLALFGVFVLVSSGLFDTAEVVAQQPIPNKNNMGSSVNLNVVNEINRLEEIVKTNPDNHENVLKLGHLLFDNKFFEKAITNYQSYLAVHPNNVDVIVDMGVCFFELKQYEKSIQIIGSALKINPKHQIANFNLGIVNLANNNPAEAKLWWEKARDINPNSNIGIKAEELLKSNN